MAVPRMELHGPLVEAGQAHAIEADPPAHLRPGRQQPEDGTRRQALAGTAFADERHRLARSDRERQTADGGKMRIENDVQVLDDEAALSGHRGP